jgi:hypothetical protein
METFKPDRLFSVRSDVRRDGHPIPHLLTIISMSQVDLISRALVPAAGNRFPYEMTGCQTQPNWTILYRPMAFKISTFDPSPQNTRRIRVKSASILFLTVFDKPEIFVSTNLAVFE